jgi:protein-disulfide isomerase
MPRHEVSESTLPGVVPACRPATLIVSTSNLCRRMRSISFKAALITAVFALGAAAGAIAADATEQTRIDKAIDAYAGKLKDDAEKASDQAIAARASALVNGSGGQVLGNPRGDVTVIEFFDYACPYCKAVEPRLQQLLNGDRNVKLVAIEFPILGPESLIAAKVSLASARQGKYASFHQALLGLRGQLSEPAIFDLAKDVGLDIERLRKDMNAPEIADAIIGNFNLARGLHITTTPTFIIDNHMVTEPSAMLDFAKAVGAARAGRR